MRKPDFVYYVLEPLVNKMLDILERRGLVTADDIEEARAQCPQKGCPVGDVCYLCPNRPKETT